MGCEGGCKSLLFVPSAVKGPTSLSGSSKAIAVRLNRSFIHNAFLPRKSFQSCPTLEREAQAIRFMLCRILVH